MHREGHIGIGLLLYAPISYAMIDLDVGFGWAVGIVAIAFWSFAPDLDQGLPIRHRGPTHSVLFAVVAGVATALVAAYLVSNGALNGGSLWNYLVGMAFGFMIGFLGVIGHIFGDSFTKMGVTPFWPWSNRKMGARVVYASNKRVNQALSTAGGVSTVVAIVLASMELPI